MYLQRCKAVITYMVKSVTWERPSSLRRIILCTSWKVRLKWKSPSPSKWNRAAGTLTSISLMPAAEAYIYQIWNLLVSHGSSPTSWPNGNMNLPFSKFSGQSGAFGQTAGGVRGLRLTQGVELAVSIIYTNIIYRLCLVAISIYLSNVVEYLYCLSSAILKAA